MSLVVTITQDGIGQLGYNQEELEFLITLAPRWDLSPEPTAQLLSAADD
jgi:hypothetical protein